MGFAGLSNMHWRMSIAAVLSSVAAWSALAASAQAQSYAVQQYRNAPPPPYYYDDDLIERPDRGYEPPRAYSSRPYPADDANPGRYGSRDPRGLPPDPYWLRPPADIPYPEPPTGSINRAPLPPAATAPPLSPGAAPRQAPSSSLAALPPEYRPEDGVREVAAQFRRQLVNYPTREPAGTIIIDTANTYL